MKKLAILTAFAVGLAASPVQAEVVAQGDDNFVTRDTAVVKAGLRETWLMLISPGKWWNSAHTFSGDAANMTLTPQAGGCFCERIPAEDTADKIGLAGSVEHMRVVLSIPDQALRMEGALGPLQSEPVNAILTVTMAKTDEGTRIAFEYAVGGFMRYKIPDISKAVDGVMTQQLNGLAEQLGPLEVADAPAVGKKAPAEDTPPDSSAEETADSEAGDDTELDDSAQEAEIAEPEEPRITVDQAFGDLDPGR